MIADIAVMPLGKRGLVTLLDRALVYSAGNPMSDKGKAWLILDHDTATKLHAALAVYLADPDKAVVVQQPGQ